VFVRENYEFPRKRYENYTTYYITKPSPTQK